MNVDKTSFNAQLPTVLKHISKSHFVAIDLELSGIHAQRRRDAEGKQNLHDRYNELKHAAEKFHILQVGITCVEQDIETQTYLIRPYNFNISPLIGHDIDVERDFTYSTGAVDFLLDHGYQMDAPFRLGVPYLTRSETEIAKERARLRWDRGLIPDIRIDASDERTLRFLERVRDEINTWQTSTKSEDTQCVICGSRTPNSEEPEAKLSLNRFERRLVHQLIRAEYPKLSAFSKGDAMHINIKTEKYQYGPSAFLQRRFEDSLFLQTGFRWVAEALIGGDLSGINPNLCGPRIAYEPDAPNQKNFAQRLEQLSDAATSRKRIVVGHNCFLDLVYFYQNFVGQLPDTVQDFQEAIHEIFPLIVDTKFMATAVPGGGPYRSSQLSQIDYALSALAEPKLDIPNGHPDYNSDKNYHEAGFDSFVTAKVFLRLTTQLEAARRCGNNQNSASTDLPLFQPDAMDRCANGGNARLDNTVETIPNNSKNNEPGEKATSRPKRKPKVAAKRISGSKFTSQNTFDSLRDLSDDGGVAVSAESDAFSRNTADPGALNIDLSKTEGARSPLSTATNVEQPEKLIPQWNTDFWRVYGNKLRVYGTVEEVLNLSEMIKSDDKAVGDTTASPNEASGSARRPPVLGSVVDKFKSFLI